MISDTRYVKNRNGQRLAYRMAGAGPALMFIPALPSAVDLLWDHPRAADFLDGLASFSRLVVIDAPGIGASDRFEGGLPSPERWIEGFPSVLSALGVDRITLLSHGNRSSPAIWISATFPDSVAGLILWNGTARLIADPGDPCGVTSKQYDELTSQAEETWGSGQIVEQLLPSLAADRYTQSYMARLQRACFGPRTLGSLARWYREVDDRPLLPSVRTPTLILHARDDPFIGFCHGQYLAAHIAGAKLVELPGRDHHWLGDDGPRVLQEVRRFVTGDPAVAADERVFATIMFVDIVDSTRELAGRGDRGWKGVLQVFYGCMRFELARFRGEEVDRSGDGLLGRFDAPTRALRCAVAIRDAVRGLGLAVRIGMHAGECEVVDGKICGLAVHIASRLAAVANPNEIVVSSTLKELVSGSGLRFADRCLSVLRGVPGEWRLYSMQ